MANKVTKKEMFQKILAVKEIAESKEMTEFIQHQIELLEKKKSGSGKQAQEKAAKDIALASALLSVMVKGEGYTISRLVSMLKDIDVVVTAPKVTSLMTHKMLPNHKVDRTEDKNVALYHKIVDETSVTSLD